MLALPAHLKPDVEIVEKWAQETSQHNFEARDYAAWSRSEWACWLKTWRGWWLPWLFWNGIRDVEEERIPDFAVRDLILASTHFKKKDEQHFTFASERIRSQVHLGVLRRSDLSNILDCKIIAAESCLIQNKALLLKLRILSGRQRHLSLESVNESSGGNWRTHHKPLKNWWTLYHR